MLVSSTGRRAEVRRSTSGWLTFSAYGTQIASATADHEQQQNDPLAAPTPAAALGDHQQQRGQRDRQQQRAQARRTGPGS